MKLSSKDLGIITESAQKYKEQLLNKKFIVIYINKATSKQEFIEVSFKKRNFLHLTGVTFTQSTMNDKKSEYFFDLCLEKKLRQEDCEYKQNGTTELKLSVLPELMQICYNANMIGDYNMSKPKLFTKKLYGNIRGCIGVDYDDLNNLCPNTALKCDVRDITTDTSTILCIASKNIDDEYYVNICRIKKNFDFQNINKEIKAKFKLLDEI